MKTDLSREEKSLLLFLETCAVDHGGLVNPAHMSAEDMVIAERWSEDSFVWFGRVLSKSLKATGKYSYWCELSEAAWLLAHAERHDRAGRMAKKRIWRKTSEK